MQYSLSFKPLSKSHFQLLLKWLKTAHVKTWWDANINWNEKLIDEKYSSYVKGFKLENGIFKEINAFIIYADNEPIGYIQLYNAHDFLDDNLLKNLPQSLANFDMFIGEKDYLKKGIGSQALNLFLKDYCDSQYNNICVSADHHNIAALKTYEKAGFKTIKAINITNEIWMLRTK